MRGVRLAHAYVLGCVLALAGCSGGGDAPTVSAPGPSSESVSGGSAESDARAVEPIRVVAPEEGMQFVAECMTEAGFHVEYEPRDGGMSWGGGTDAQHSDLQRQQAICEQLYPVDERYTQPLTRSQLDFLYHWYVSEGVPCLQDAGIAVDEPPTLQTWVESYDTEPWVPWSSVRAENLSEEEWLDLNERCPQGPPSELLYAE